MCSMPLIAGWGEVSSHLGTLRWAMHFSRATKANVGGSSFCREIGGIFEGVSKGGTDTNSVGRRDDLVRGGDLAQSGETQLVSGDLPKLIHSDRSRLIGSHTVWIPRCRYRQR